MSAVRAFPPLMRPEISDLMDAARLVRRATRQLVDHREKTEPALDHIDAAIGKLVAARLIVTSAATAAPSKDL